MFGLFVFFFLRASVCALRCPITARRHVHTGLFIGGWGCYIMQIAVKQGEGAEEGQWVKGCADAVTLLQKPITSSDSWF